MNFFNKCFNCQIRFMKFLYRNNSAIVKIIYILYAVIFFEVILLYIVPSVFIKYISFGFIGTLSLTILFMGVSNIIYIFISLRKFLLYGLFIEILLSSIFTILLNYILDLHNPNIKILLIIFSSILTWFLLSLIANNKDLILSTLLGIIVYLKDLIFEFLPDNLFESEIKFINQLGYSNKQIYELIFSLVLTPILITNVLAALLCELKAYWIEKYNNGVDITLELIKEKFEK